MSKWNIDEGIKQRFFEVCQQASKDNNFFVDFKRHADFRQILEHVGQAEGKKYFYQILRDNPALVIHLNSFAENDRIGNPIAYEYHDENYGNWTFSPTTLRYIKVLSDLISLVGPLDNLNIAEIGCGYGGQCKIIHDAFRPKSYTLFDDSDVTCLQKKYLQHFNMYDSNIKFNELQDHYDLVISNYAFDELAEETKIWYKSNIIDHSNAGYFTIVNDVQKFLPDCKLYSQNHLYDLPFHFVAFFNKKGC